MTDTTLKPEDLIKRYLELDTIRADVEAQQKTIKAQLREGLGLGEHITGAGPVSITPNRRFNPALAAEVLGAINPDLLKACQVQTIDSATVKRMVGGDVYERCMKIVGEPKVAFR